MISIFSLPFDLPSLIMYLTVSNIYIKLPVIYICIYIYHIAITFCNCLSVNIFVFIV